MKDSEFIELLNLYLDHEITAADAARLETEVQSNPERRRVYQQYCRMHKACMLLAKDFVEQSDATPAAAPRKVVAFEPRRPAWGSGVFATGALLAAAACVALVLVHRFSDQPAVPSTLEHVALAIAAPAPSGPPVETKVHFAPTDTVADHASISRTVTVPAAYRSEFQPVIATRALALGGSLKAQDQVTSTDVVPHLDWIGRLKIAPMQRVQLEDLRFEARPTEAVSPASFGARNRPSAAGVEMTAFQFQK